MDKDVFRAILRNQIIIMSVLRRGADSKDNEELRNHVAATNEVLADQYLCEHIWEDGFSMNGPTKTCKLCRKFERD